MCLGRSKIWLVAVRILFGTLEILSGAVEKLSGASKSCLGLPENILCGRTVEIVRGCQNFVWTTKICLGQWKIGLAPPKVVWAGQRVLSVVAQREVARGCHIFCLGQSENCLGH